VSGADRLLALVVRLLPPSRAEWGRAMRAEAAAIEPGAERWRHATGCARAVLTLPVVARALGYALLGVAALAAVRSWSAGIAYAPLRRGLLTAAALLLAAAWAGRWIGPVAPGRAARAVRAGACGLIGAVAAAFAVVVAVSAAPREQALAGVPVMTAMLLTHLAGLLALTSARAGATARDLGIAVAASVAAAAWWPAVQLLVPPVPGHAGGAIVVTGFGIAAAGYLARNRLQAALCVATVTPLLLFTQVLLLSRYGPAWLLPDLMPAALTPAADLAGSRIEVVDPYVALPFLAGLAALTLTLAVVAPGPPAVVVSER